MLTRIVDNARPWLDVVDLTHVLKDENRLTPTFLLRALCLGEMRLFDTGIATLAQIPVENAHLLIRDQNRVAFSRLYKKASLPHQTFRGFRIALDFVLKQYQDQETEWQEAYTAQILEAIVRNHRRLAPGSLDTVILQLARQIENEPNPGSPLRPKHQMT